ncbi:MAG: hypothetical protein IPG02_10740 [Ignavibacteria bacterium]|nr:hypothetical protein [Ignavibacteria bacterium]
MKEWFPNDVDKYKFVDCSDLKDSNCDLYKTLNVANKDYPFALELIYNYWLEEGFTCQTLLQFLRGIAISPENGQRN